LIGSKQKAGFAHMIKKRFIAIVMLIAIVAIVFIKMEDSKAKQELLAEKAEAKNLIALLDVQEQSSEETEQDSVQGQSSEATEQEDSIQEQPSEASKKRALAQQAHSLADEKLVALTFDDGPHPQHTEDLLDFLKAERVPATFFILGVQGEKHPDILSRMEKEGHQLAVHSYDHVDFTKLSLQDAQKQINQTNQVIKDATGVDATVMRPPFGAINDQVTKNVDMPQILWNIDTMDWKHRDANYIYNTIVKNTEDGSVILLHDIYGTSVEGAKRAIKKLKKDGYTFVTIDVLMNFRDLGLVVR